MKREYRLLGIPQETGQEDVGSVSFDAVSNRRVRDGGFIAQPVNGQRRASVQRPRLRHLDVAKPLHVLEPDLLEEPRGPSEVLAQANAGAVFGFPEEHELPVLFREVLLVLVEGVSLDPAGREELLYRVVDRH